MTKHQLLYQYFGHTSFRDGQEKAVDSLLEGRDVLAVMPTGAGKSVCYQLPALMMHGITIVISPLISLMKDQVENLRQGGIPAAYINSIMTAEEYRDVMLGVRSGRYRIIYAAPERLLTESFMRFALENEISMITIDESHCVSQWGQDFRQSYLNIAEFAKRLPVRPVMGAFTATATKQVREDIINLLGLREPAEIVTGFDRKNLYFGVKNPKDKMKELVTLLKKYKNRSGIVYCLSRKLVEEVCEDLCRAGFAAVRYHAGLPPEERAANQEDFIYDRKNIMVATNAFGMGIDKSNVSFVIHYNMPKDIESYYQEAGRAGRDGEPADCILLYSGKDVRLNNFLIEQSAESSEIGNAALRRSLADKSKSRLRSMTFYCTSVECQRNYMLRYFGEYPAALCGNCSGCLNNTEKKDITREAVKIISCVYRGQQKGIPLNRTLTAQVLSGSTQKNVLEKGLHSLSTYGIMKEYSVSDIVYMTDAMTMQGFLGIKNRYELCITPQSAEVIRNEKKVVIQVPKKEKEKEDTLPQNVSAEEEELFQLLRGVREKISKREHVPPYVVFSNAVLRDMCRRKPLTREELMQVSGVGMMRSQKYGDEFIREIKIFSSKRKKKQKK